MNWAAATGLSAISVAVVALVVLILKLVWRILDLGNDNAEARNAQLDAEHFKREAEDQRDDAVTRAVKAENERDNALKALSAARAACATFIEKRKDELHEQIDAGTDDDLIALSHSVFGSPLPKASGSSESAAAGSGDPADTVSPGRTTI